MSFSTRLITLLLITKHTTTEENTQRKKAKKYKIQRKKYTKAKPKLGDSSSPVKAAHMSEFTICTQRF